MALAVLSIDIEARLAKLQADLDQAGRLAEKNAEQIRASYARVASIGVGLGKVIASAFAGFEIVDFIKRNAEAIDALNDVKDATGASIEKISGLEQVALKTGATLDTVSDVLIKFNKGLNEGNPNGPTTQALKAIGLSAAELRKLDPADALQKVAIALDQYADDGNKARLIQELFGKSVKEAAPFLHDLADAGELNAKITTEQAAQAETFNKQLFQLKTNSENTARAIASELVPRINALFEAYAKFGGFKGTIAAVFGQDELSQANRRVQALDEQVKLAGENVERLAAGLARDPGNELLGTFLERAKNKLRALTKESLDASTNLTALIGKMDDRPSSGIDFGREGDFPKPSLNYSPTKPDAAALQEQKRYEDLIKKIKERLDISQAELATNEKLSESDKLRLDVESELAAVQLSEPHRAKIKALLDEAVASGKLREAQIEGTKLTQQETRANAAYAQSLDEQNRTLREQYEELGLTVRQVEELRIARLAEALARKEEQLASLRLVSADSEQYQQLQLLIEALREQIKLRKESREKADDIARDPFKGASDALAAYAEQLEKTGDAMRESLQSSLATIEDSLTTFFTTGKLNASKFADEIIAQIVRIGIVKPLVNSAAQGIGALFGLGDSKSSAGNIFSLFASFGGGFFASGGDHAGGLRVVGENGPELEATGPARIWNFDQTRQILGGGGGKSTQIIYSPTLNFDSTVDRARALADAEQVMRRGQREYTDMLKARRVL